MARKKERKIQIEKEEFMDRAKPIPVMIDDQRVITSVREFRSGSFGWAHTGKVVVRVGDQYIDCVVNVNIVVNYSKPKVEEEG